MAWRCTSCEMGIHGACLTPVIDGVADRRDSVRSEAEKSATDQQVALCCSRGAIPGAGDWSCKAKNLAILLSQGFRSPGSVEIRTLRPLGPPVFKTGAFNRSAALQSEARTINI